MGDWDDITREIELVIGERLNNLQSSILNHQGILETTVEKLNQLSHIAKERLGKLKTIPEDTHHEQPISKVLSPRAATHKAETMHKDTKSLALEQSKVHEPTSKPDEKVSKLEEVKKKKAEEAKKKKEEEENKKKEQLAKKKEEEIKKKEEEAKKKEESKKKIEEKKKHDELEKKSKLEEMKEKKKQEELEKKSKLEEEKRLAEEEKSKKKLQEEEKKKKQDEDKKKQSDESKKQPEDPDEKPKDSQKSKIGLPRPKGLQAPTSIAKPSQPSQPSQPPNSTHLTQPAHPIAPRSPSGGSRIRSASPSRFKEKSEDSSKPQTPSSNPPQAPNSNPNPPPPSIPAKESSPEVDTSLKIPDEANEKHFEEESFLISADGKIPDISYFTESPIKHSVPAEPTSLSSSLYQITPDKTNTLDQPSQEILAEEAKLDQAEPSRPLNLKLEKSSEVSQKFQKRSSVAITLTNPTEESIKSGFFNHRASSFAGLSTETFSRSVIPAQMSVQDIDMQLSVLESSYSQSELTTEKRFDLSVGAKSALSLLTTMDDSKFYMNTVPSAEVVWSFRVFFRLAGRSLSENDEEAWNECREFLANARNKELNGKSIDKVVIEFMGGYDYSDENVDLLEVLVFEKESLMTPQYFTSLCPLTGLFMFALREAAIYAGVIKGKIPVSRQYKRLIHKKKLIGN